MQVQYLAGQCADSMQQQQMNHTCDLSSLLHPRHYIQLSSSQAQRVVIQSIARNPSVTSCSMIHRASGKYVTSNSYTSLAYQILLSDRGIHSFDLRNVMKNTLSITVLLAPSCCH